MKRHALAAGLLIILTSSVLAGPAADGAKDHFKAIASGDLQRITGAYADNARLNWVGGPLNGTYDGLESIRAVWDKFVKAQGPLKLIIGKMEESANPQGATVTANVQFEGKQPIKVRYVLTYRDGRLVSETWQIDPHLSMAEY
jgi:ketosteroid isomerase-like protein